MRNALLHREATARRLVGATRTNGCPTDADLKQTEREEPEVPCKLPVARVHVVNTEELMVDHPPR